MDIQYEYMNQAIADEFRDTFPVSLACVPRVGDIIEGEEHCFCLSVMAVTLRSHQRVLVTLGMETPGLSNPHVRNAVS